MADLEAVLADVSYLMAMEKSKCTPAARASKKIVLPDPRYVDTIPRRLAHMLNKINVYASIVFTSSVDFNLLVYKTFSFEV